MMDDNAPRAERAQKSLEWYKKNALEEEGLVDDTDLSDLLTDLRHLCSRNGFDFQDAVLRSWNHFQNELRDAEENSPKDCSCWKCGLALWTDEVASQGLEEPLCSGCHHDREFEAGRV